MPGQVVNTSNFSGLGRVASTIPTDSLIIKASPGVLRSLVITNGAVATNRVFFILNAIAVPVGATNVSAIMLHPPILLAARATFTLEPAAPIVASIGIVVASSTTLSAGGPIWEFTEATSDDCAFQAYIQ